MLLLLDINCDHSLGTSPRQDKNLLPNQMLNFDTAVESHHNAAKVQIGTLSPYVDFRSGIYKMTAVKRMTAKNDFLKMPMKDRKCSLDLYEDCRTRKLLETCSCVPWEMTHMQVTSQLQCLIRHNIFVKIELYAGWQKLLCRGEKLH